MSVFEGKVVNGRIEVPDLDLPEGTQVVVILERDGEPVIKVSAEELAEVEAAIAEADLGGGTPAEEFLHELRARRARV